MVQQRLNLTKYRFRFQFWTLYTIQISSNLVTLYVDGVLIDQQSHSVALPSVQQNLTISKPTSLSYLLFQLTLADSKNTTTYFTRTFTQNLIGQFQKSYLQQGSLQFESNNQLCPSMNGSYTPSSYISGTTCKDTREYAYFNKNAYRSGISMTGSMKSSMGTMTIEMWIKDLNNNGDISGSNQQVLFENSVDSNNVLIRVMLLDTGLDSSDQVKGFRVYSYLNQYPNKNVMLTSSKTYNNWLHLSVISNQTSIKINLFNATKGSVVGSIQQSDIVFYGSNNDINTSIGSTIGGQLKFQGFLREFRLWSVARTDNDLSTYRYNTNVMQRVGLLYSFRLNTGINQFQVQDNIQNKFFNELRQNTSSITWDTEKDLILCRQGQFFDGQCCQDVNLSALDFHLALSTSKNTITLRIYNTSSVNQAFMNSVYANFSLHSLGFTFNSTIFNQINSIFAANYSQGYTISSLLVHPLVYNLTIQAKIFSIYDKSVMTVSRSLNLQCPGFYLQVNDDPVENKTYLVSNASDAYLKVTLRTVQNTTQCYNPWRRRAENISVSLKVWSQNVTSPALRSLWSVSDDNVTLTQLSGVSNLNKYLRVSVRVYYNITMIQDQNLNLTYVTFYAKNDQFQTNTFIRNLLQYSALDIDLSSSYSTFSTYSQLVYSVVCPSELFKNATQYNTLCRIPQSGKFQMKTTSNQGLQIVYNRKYSFTYLIQLNETSVVRNLTGIVTWYQDGSSNTVDGCPSLTFKTRYDYDKVLNNSLEIYPDPYTYCSGVFYEIYKIVWTVTDAVTPARTYVNVLNQTNSSVLSTYVYKDNDNVQNVPGGSLLNLNGKFTFLPVTSNTNYSLSSQNVSINRTTSIQFKKNPLVPQIITHSFTRTQLNPKAIGFLEPNITLNGSTSYDPDNKTANLTYSWTCPSNLISTTQCQSLLTGTRNNSLVISLINKFVFDFRFNQTYYFNLTIQVKDNPNKEPVTLSYPIVFSYPQIDDVAIDMKNTTCEYLETSGSDITKSSDNLLSQTIEFNKNNYNQKIFSVEMKLDNGQTSTSTKSPCGTANVEYQYMFYYMYQIDPTNLTPLLVQNIMPVSKSFSTSVALSDYEKLAGINRDQYLKSTVFLFTKRQSSTRLYLNTKDIYLIRRFAPLVAVLKSEEISLDYYQNLVIDGSGSYDSEDSTKTSLTYQWSCPSGVNLCSTTGSNLNVKYIDRLNNGINEVGSSYDYSVYVAKNQRQSDPITAQVSISKKDDYSDCISVSLSQSQKSLIADFERENRTIFLEYQQNANIVIQMEVTKNCDNVNVYTPTWTLSNTNQQNFWNVDSKNPNRISITSSTIKNMTAGVTSTILYKQQISMGQDTEITYDYSTYINLFLNKPDLKPVINGQATYVIGGDYQIFMDASPSYDPLGLGYKCQWDCPTFLGGSKCTSNCTFSMSFADIKKKIGSDSLYYYSDNSYSFNLTLYSVDNERAAYQTYYVYISSGNKQPFKQYGIQDCQLKLYGKDNFVVYSTNVYYFACQKDNLTSYIINSQYFVNNWNVQGLTPFVDYYNQSGQLFLKPYAVSKLQTLNNLYISLNITGVSQTFRQLQDDDDLNSDTDDNENSGDGTTDDTADDTSGDNTDDTTDDTTGEDTDNNTDNSTDDNTDDNSDDTDNSGNNNNTDNSTNNQNNTSNNNSTSNNQTNTSSNQNRTAQPPYIETNATTKRLPDSDNKIKASFSFKRDILQNGLISVTSNSTTGYTTLFSFTFSDFSSKSKANLFFQMRGYQNIYQANQIIIPLKNLDTDAIATYYTNMYIPLVSSLYFDFYDMNMNYVGSYDLYNQSFVGMNLGNYQFKTMEKVLLAICQKNIFDYDNTDEGRLQFEQDMKRLLEFTEMISLGAIYGYNDIVVSSYAQKIVTYLKINLKDTLSYYSTSGNIAQSRVRYANEKRAILIIYNLIKVNSGVQSKVLSILDSIDACMQDYDAMVKSGEDADFLRSTILYLQSVLNIELVNLNLNNKATYYTKLYTITNTIYQSDVSSTTQKVTQYTSSNSSRTVYKIDSTSQSSLQISNALNTVEKVTFSNEALLATLKISSLVVEFTTDTSNSSSPVTTALTITAFDSASKNVDVDLTKNKQGYFGIQLSTTLKTVSLFTKNPDAYQLQCVYYDTLTNKWLTTGMELNQYDIDSAVVDCKSYHLTKFSVQYIQISDTTNNNNNTNNNGTNNNNNNNNTNTNNNTNQNNNTNNNNQTNNNNTNQNNNTNHQPSSNATQNLVVVDETYYEANTGAFGAAVAIPLIGVIAFIAISFFFRYNGKYDNEINGKPMKSILQTSWAVYKINHPLISAIFRQTNGTLAIPKPYNVTSLFIYIFTIVPGLLIQMISIDDYNFTPGKIVVFSIVYLIIMTILRPIFNKIKYTIYFRDALIIERDPHTIRERSYITEEQQEFRNQSRQSRLKPTNSHRNQDVFEDHENFEGGSSEEDSSNEDDYNYNMDKRGDGSEFQRSGFKNIGHKASPGQKGGISDMISQQQIHLDFESNESLQITPGKGIQINQHLQMQKNKAKAALDDTGKISQEIKKDRVNFQTGQRELMKQGNNNYRVNESDDEEPDNSYVRAISPNKVGSEFNAKLGSQNKSNGKGYDGLAGMNMKNQQIDIVIEHHDLSSSSPNITDLNSSLRSPKDIEEQKQDKSGMDLSFDGKKKYTPNKDISSDIIQPKQIVKPSPSQKSNKKEALALHRDNDLSQIQSINDDPEVQLPQNSKEDYEIPKKQMRHVKKYTVDDNDFDKTLVIDNSHDYKGMRLLLLIILFIILITDMAITFGVMKQVKTQDNLNQWIYAVIGVVIFFVIIYDLITGMIYAIIFRKVSVKSKTLMVYGALLIGNTDIRATYSLLLELKD